MKSQSFSSAPSYSVAFCSSTIIPFQAACHCLHCTAFFPHPFRQTLMQPSDPSSNIALSLVPIRLKMPSPKLTFYIIKRSPFVLLNYTYHGRQNNIFSRANPCSNSRTCEYNISCPKDCNKGIKLRSWERICIIPMISGWWWWSLCNHKGFAKRRQEGQS